MQELNKKLDKNFDKYLGKLKEFVRIPSISNPNFDQKEVEKSAFWLKNELENLGCEVKVVTSKIEGTDKQGALGIIAKKKSKNKDAKTILLYAHHDVQPVNSENDWKTKPFNPTIIGDRMFGRGAADDGAGVISHLATLDLLGEDLGVNITLLIEGEEEIGSPSFSNFVKDNKDDLKADIAFIADSGEVELGVPTITSTLRGVVQISVELDILEHDVHSGMFSGPIIDPNILISRLLSKFHDENGELLVEGLVSYDEGEDLYTQDEFIKDSSLKEGVELVGTGTLQSRLWTKPTISLVGLDIPKPESASCTIQGKTTAILSLRIAPGDDPYKAYELVKDFIIKNAEFGIIPKVSLLEAGPAFKSNLNTQSVKLLDETYREVWGRDVAYAGMGGSIPLTATLEENFPNMEVLIIAVEDPDSRAHSANESVHLGELKRIILAQSLFIQKISK